MKKVGSPPHLRGKLHKRFDFVTTHRITPAPAGKTAVGPDGVVIVEDHPRTCGENFF